VRPIKRLRLERQNHRITQRALATVAGVTQPTVSMAETGRLTPTHDELRRLAAVFHVDPDDLLKDVTVLRSER
jgi:transcriptional regulator with XRE-family HTH domain